MDNYNPTKSMELELSLRRAIDALREDYDDHSDYTDTINGMLGDNDTNDPEAASLMLEGISEVVDLIKEERDDDDPLVEGVENVVAEWQRYLDSTCEVVDDYMKTRVKVMVCGAMRAVVRMRSLCYDMGVLADYHLGDGEKADSLAKIQDILEDLEIAGECLNDELEGIRRSVDRMAVDINKEEE